MGVPRRHRERQLTAQLQAVLREQEILLREVHHRIKNNFQTIISFLDLQAEVIEDPRVLAALEASQQRLQAMALVHQSLYQSRTWTGWTARHIPVVW